MSLRWPAEAIWEAVSPQWPSFSVEILPEIDSTNTELMRRARRGQCEPVLLLAERQTAGRGRLGREWHSEPQALGTTLTFSLGVPLAPADWSGFSLAVGLAVVQALHRDLQLKWPNDVWWHERKLAGILIETASAGDTRYAVIGIGINIGPRDAQGLRTAPAWLQEVLPEAGAPDTLLRVVPALARAVQDFAHHGFAPLRTVFHARDCLHGLAVVCSDGSHGIARGVDASGALLVHTDKGVIKISSAEVSVRPAVDGLPTLLS